MAWRTLLILGWMVSMLALGTQPSLAITPYDDVLVQQAAKDIQQENYDEALVAIERGLEQRARIHRKKLLCLAKFTGSC